MRNFLENRPVIAAKQDKMEVPIESPLLQACHQVVPTQSQEFPKLELKHDAEGKIKEIVVICHCGERIVLQCTY